MIKNRLSISSGLTLLLTLLSQPLLAANLMDVYKLAERADAQIRAAASEYYSAKQSVPLNRAALLPQLNATVSQSSVVTEPANNEAPRDIDGDGTLDSNFCTPNVPNSCADIDRFNFNLVLTQTLYDHSLWLRLKQANVNVASAEATYNAARQDLIVRVAEAYFNVLAAADNLEFAKAEKTSVEQQLEQAKQRFDVGLIAITDVKESQAEFDQAVASEIQARNSLSAAREALWTITNQHEQQLKALSEKLPLILPEPANKQQWVEKALAENLSLLSAQFDRDAAQREVGIQRSSGRYPTLQLRASKGLTDTTNNINSLASTEIDDTNIGVQLNIPIFQGGATHSRIKQAIYQRDAARDNLEATRRQVIQQTRNAYQSVVADISRVKALKQALASSQAAYEATEAGFEVGTRNSVEVLISLRNTFAARRDYAQTRYDYVLNVLRLKQAAGNLSVTDLEAVNRWLQ